jgi:hypothetical protein
LCCCDRLHRSGNFAIRAAGSGCRRGGCALRAKPAVRPAAIHC